MLLKKNKSLELQDLLEIKKNIKFIISDLDGTLLDEASNYSSTFPETIKLLEEKGIKFTIASGRTPNTVTDAIKGIGLTIPAIASDGGALSNYETSEVYWADTMDRQLALDICNLLDKHGFTEYLLMTVNGKFYISDNGREKKSNDIETLKDILDCEYLHVYLDELKKDPNFEPILKIDVCTTSVSESEQIIELIKNLPILPTISSPTILDITPKHVNKASGILQLVSNYGCTLDNVCYFGDYDNDLTALNSVALPIGMYESSPRVTSTCKLKAPSNEANGEERLIRALFLTPFPGDENLIEECINITKKQKLNNNNIK